jgi:hypothetical protein
MGNLIRSEFKRARQYYCSTSFLPLGYRWKLVWGTKPFTGHHPNVEWTVFIDREEAFVVCQAAKYLLDPVNFRPVFWVIARKYDFCLSLLITSRAYDAPNRPNGHVDSDVLQCSI